MMSKIGRTKSSGFSLIELMITVSVVMMAAVLLQGSYMRSMEIFGRYTHSLKAMVWMGEQMAKAKESLLYSEDYNPSDRGTLMDEGKALEWSQDIRSASRSNLYAIRLNVNWTESGKPVTLESEQYVYKPDLSQAA